MDDLEIDEASNLTEQKGLSMSMASLYSEGDLFKRPRGAPDGASDILSAEGVALSLISRFNEKQLPRYVTKLFFLQFYQTNFLGLPI